MNKFTKILLASILTLSFAAPAFAGGEEDTLQERNVYLYPNGPAGKRVDRPAENAYASTYYRREQKAMRATARFNSAPAVDVRDLGIGGVR